MILPFDRTARREAQRRLGLDRKPIMRATACFEGNHSFLSSGGATPVRCDCGAYTWDQRDEMEAREHAVSRGGLRAMALAAAGGAVFWAAVVYVVLS